MCYSLHKEVGLFRPSTTLLGKNSFKLEKRDQSSWISQAHSWVQDVKS